MTREEALKIVRENYPHFGTTEPWLDLEKALATLIPELAESEDERIRKAIESIIRVYGKTQGEWIAGYDMDTLVVHLRDAFTYLEKQKVNTEGDFGRGYDCGYQAGYAVAVNEMKQKVATVTLDSEKQKEPHYTKRNALFDECVKNCDPDVMKKVSDEVDEMLQKEQKPLTTEETELNSIAFLEQMGYTCIPPRKEQKPVEKQDYSGLNDFERAIHRGFLAAGVENVPVTIIKETAKECLAQMEPAEWCDEDEKMLKWLCRIIHSRVVNKELSLAEESELGKWMDKWINHEPQHEKKWSEFDEDCLRRAIWYVENPAPSVVKDTNLVLWLQTLPGRFNLQPNNEWSEEDRKMYKMLSSMIHGTFVVETQETQDKLLSWLKAISSRPKSSDNWKPSEEQIKTLDIVISDYRHACTKGSDKKAEILEPLLEQLKKLM